jgi:MoaA/NifB/PqqE/SkfB family radical SAM enzyme
MYTAGCTMPCAMMPNFEFLGGRTEKQNTNIQKAKESFYGQQTIVSHYPVIIELPFDWYCNMRCPHCNQRRIVDKHIDTRLKIQDFRQELIDFLSYAIEVCVLGGEATICPDWNPLMNMVMIAGGAKINLVTNGQFLIQKVIPNIELFNNISVSADAATAKTYSKVRPSNDDVYNFDRLIFNLQKVSQLKKIYHSFCFSLSFVINGYNYHEMKEMAELCKEFNCDVVCFNETSYLPYDELTIDEIDYVKWGHKKENFQVINNLLDESLALAKKYGIEVFYQFPLSIKRCGWQSK